MTLSKNYKRLNENSKLTLQQWLKDTEAKLAAADIGTARLDALVLLADELGRDKAWLLTHNDEPLPPKTARKLNRKVSKRLTRVPMAYIRGKQEFYGRDFVVNKRVLIPRPESEALIDQLKYLPQHKTPVSKEAPWKLLDVGTGSGALAISAALELPNVNALACDTSEPALAIATDNAKRLGAKVEFFISDLLTDAPGGVDCIIANLPYVDVQWQRSPETQFEPQVALFADDGGLKLIKKLITQVPGKLSAGGYLLLEADPRQHGTVIKFAQSYNLELVNQKDFALVFKRSAVGRPRA